jgi:DNA repair protein RadC
MTAAVPSADEKYGPAGHRKRLRERFTKSGPDSLADYELLELLLTYGLPRVDTKPMAKALLDQFGSLVGVLQQPERRLVTVKGLGPEGAFFVKVVRACLARSMQSAVENEPSVSGPEDIFAFIRLHLGPRVNECVYALYLDDARRVVYHAEISAGTVDRAPIYPREVFKPALLHNATGIVLVHNHPEGQPVPSEHDMQITQMLEEVATPLGISLIDHLIVSRLQAYSIKTGKLL